MLPPGSIRNTTGVSKSRPKPGQSPRPRNIRHVIMIEVHPAHRNSRTSLAWLYVILILIMAIYYLFLVSGGGLNLFKPIEAVLRGMAFNSMLENLRHGEFDVDPSTIGCEGVVRDGKT